jgi:type III restriction enzyme
METGTGKTYCYIKTAFELNKRYGWSKFVIVVPSIAIREGVYKSLTITAEHFLESYGKKARFFIYNSKQLHNLESFSSDAGLSIMVINVQAFTAKSKDNLRIYQELDDFQSRRPIDVISANRPVLILDEPQKMEGAVTLDSLKAFKPLMILRYSATHKTTYDKIYRLDAIDAYNQKLVKKIEVRGISVKGLSGTNAFLYLEDIEVSKRPPVARLQFEIKQSNEIKKIVRKISQGDNLFELSNELDEYRGFVVSDIIVNSQTISFTNGQQLSVGEAIGDVDESSLRRLQIIETIKAHFEKEKILFYKGIKVLSLFFIDTVSKYRCYDEQGENAGEYAKIFEEEYNRYLNEVLTLENSEYNNYLKGINVKDTHNGYFSIDKKSKRFVDPITGKKSTETDDVDAYDLILKDKERLLSFEEPVRFIFSHSALREGWDNPNVFVICTLKHSDNTVSRRQEVGRGLRLSVNKEGERMDNPDTVHHINVLTVVANESYKDFVSALQKDIRDSLVNRPKIANESYFSGKVLKTNNGDVEVTPLLAKEIYGYLSKNDYTDKQDCLTSNYHEAREQQKLAQLPLALQPYQQQVFALVDNLFSDASLPKIEDSRGQFENKPNDNFKKKQFNELWKYINKKAVYSVNFDTEYLIHKCIDFLNTKDRLIVTTLRYTVEKGTLVESSLEKLNKGEAFEQESSETFKNYNHSIHSSVRYDLIGKIAEGTELTRKTVARILVGLNKAIFNQYLFNPEDFINKVIKLINEQKASTIISHITYNQVGEFLDSDVFVTTSIKLNPENPPLKRHIYDYLITDSNIEKNFLNKLELEGSNVEVYAKLPKTFYIPTPVGHYTPDWAIAFKHGKVKHLYFVAETKGSTSKQDLRGIELLKTECAEEFFKTFSNGSVKYGVIDNYDTLLNLILL